MAELISSVAKSMLDSSPVWLKVAGKVAPPCSLRALNLVVLEAVAAEPVVAKVVARRPKYGVNVVGIVGQFRVGRDHAVIFDEESGAVDAVVDGLARLRRTHPGEMHFIKAGGADGVAIGARNVRADVGQVLVEEGLEQFTLCAAQAGE